MKFTGEQIQAARMLAEAIDPIQLDALFPIDWDRTNRDKRKGSVHAWHWAKNGRAYLGQFKTHAAAYEHGANVTKFAGKWFLWSTELMYVVSANAS